MGGIMDILMIAVVGIGGFMLFRSMNQQQQPPQIITVPAPDPVAPAETVPVEPVVTEPVATEVPVEPVADTAAEEDTGGEGDGEDEDEDEDDDNDNDNEDHGDNTKQVNKNKAARDATSKRVNELTKKNPGSNYKGSTYAHSYYTSYRSRSGPRKMYGYYY